MPDLINNLSLPEWINDPSKPTPGIDLLGLRIQAQRVSNSLLDGITTVSPRIRYLSFRAWIIYKYYNLRLPDNWESFINFVVKMEAAFVKGNLLINPDENQLVGSIKATEITFLDGNWQLNRLVKQLAYQAYTGPSQQLMIDADERPSGIPNLTKNRGIKLSEIIDNLLQNSGFDKKLKHDKDIDSLTENELLEIGNSINISNLEDNERQLLIEIIIPSKPQSTENHNELPRLKSYCLLLFISGILGDILTEDKIFKFVNDVNSTVPDILEEIRLNWLLYFTSDMFAVVFEANLELIRSTINSHFEPLKPINIDFVLNDILKEKHLVNQTLKDLNLMSDTETYETLSFTDFFNNFQNSLGNITHKDGINMWNSNLNELEIILASKSKDINVIAFLPISLLIIHFRFKDGLNPKKPFVDKILKTGFNEINYEYFIMKKIREWQNNNTPLIDVIAFLLEYVVEQHNHIIWSRLAFDTKRNTTIIIKDNESWSTTVNKFTGGRTQSRLKQVIGWLKELSLIDNNGLTQLGTDTLQNRIDLISRNINNES